MTTNFTNWEKERFDKVSEDNYKCKNCGYITWKKGMPSHYKKHEKKVKK